MTAFDKNQFTLPDLGEGVHEGQVICIHVKEGQDIKEDQPLMEVETDKAAVEIPSPVTGRVETVHVAENQLVHVGDVMITFAGGKGTTEAPPTAPQAVSAPSSSRKSLDRSAGVVGASPSVRRLARKLGVDLSAVQGTGPRGRVTSADVESATNPDNSPPDTAPQDKPPPDARPPTEAVPADDAYGPVRRERLSQARKTISRVMQTSWQTIPHVTDCNDADITELDKQRRAYTDTDHPERRLTTLAYVIRAVCNALQEHPILNARIDADRDEVVYREYINIAVGVETPRGLVAPVMKNADQLDLGDIADQLAAMAAKARDGSFGIEETRGATYVISNAGAMGSTRYSTPIIMAGTVGCLALGRAREMPWVVEGTVVPRLILPLSHSMDHRLVDGGREIPFIERVIADLEDPR